MKIYAFNATQILPIVTFWERCQCVAEGFNFGCAAAGGRDPH
jgi:hypothetical protein